jgi:hypothetical protein
MRIKFGPSPKRLNSSTGTTGLILTARFVVPFFVYLTLFSELDFVRSVNCDDYCETWISRIGAEYTI